MERFPRKKEEDNREVHTPEVVEAVLEGLQDKGGFKEPGSLNATEAYGLRETLESITGKED